MEFVLNVLDRSFQTIFMTEYFLLYKSSKKMSLDIIAEQCHCSRHKLLNDKKKIDDIIKWCKEEMEKNKAKK